MGVSKYIDRAIHLAHSSEHNFKHAAVIVKGNKILSEASNKYIQGSNVPNIGSIHAEENAIKLAKDKKDLRGATIYIARVASYGPAMSKPCHRCQYFIKHAGIKRIIYTSEMCGLAEDVKL